MPPKLMADHQMLAKLHEHLGEHHSGALKQESAELKAERIIAAELKRLGWSNSDLSLRLKGDPAKMAIALRLRQRDHPHPETNRQTPLPRHRQKRPHALPQPHQTYPHRCKPKDPKDITIV